jgi:enhancing lycopene biosynthesis protein 2
LVGVFVGHGVDVGVNGCGVFVGDEVGEGVLVFDAVRVGVVGKTFNILEQVPPDVKTL